MKTIRVVAALIFHEGKLFATQRGYGAWRDYWEFPGGKIEPGETPEQALARECREELDLAIENERIIDSVIHEYPEKTIRLTLISCTPKLGSVPRANEHQAIRWVTTDEMREMDFAPADKELIQKLFT